MPDLACRVESVEAVAHAATPTLAFRLRVLSPSPGESIAAIALQCQLLIDVPRRRHSDDEIARLAELFGDATRPGHPLRALLWTHASVNVPAFDTECVVDLLVPCSFDFNAAATKYFHALEAGGVPLCLQFSGSVFFRDAAGRLQISRIPWSTEAQATLPMATWQALRDRYYPNTAWLCLERPAFERLCDYKRRAGLPTWEHALDRLLDAAEATRGPVAGPPQ